ncbi:sodium/glutamate symporter [Paramaledivibacter caminithermalis]|jgi:ESS family glutamate:Na+ symporter|uniref:Sodium/glutamate symporter n=1 Tax=Paramaledivibacter caminithermalis (strain DSM 15212 / CIP 107654 / DViRD3) TaxID=1121301 RepID=A0A1M6QVX5_PARC5|nr:sodium/glutamate symporter [Paramaledivibacter caminithermalis]SHK24391.1 glutamate:Na+ symporter, ESS family [Paramaledivibacter caminithermalis DSM 15212]
MVLNLNVVQTLALAVLVLLLGQGIKKKVNFFEKFCIPAPVIGGLIFAIFILISKQTGMLTLEMDMTLKSLFMTAFFTTVGFTASFKLLKKGGLQVIVFLIFAIILVILQDIVGISLAKVFKINPLIGLSTGSVPMTGGHGTSGAFAPIFEKAGAVGATTVAMASATFGLIMGSMIGGPLGKRLIEKNNLLVKQEKTDDIALAEVAITEVGFKSELNSNSFMAGASQIIIAMGLGTLLSIILEKTGLTFPPYIGAMFAAAIIRNISDFTGAYKVYGQEIDIIGNTSLSIFLAMALMGLKLWQLADLAGPLIVMLLAQAFLMGLFAYFVTFNVMGRDYEAAVMACGHCGFGMGATPNAMANMNAISEKFGPSPRAFFILPLIGSLFIDFFNAGIITYFMNLFVK